MSSQVVRMKSIPSTSAAVTFAGGVTEAAGAAQATVAGGGEVIGVRLEFFAAVLLGEIAAGDVQWRIVVPGGATFIGKLAGLETALLDESPSVVGIALGGLFLATMLRAIGRMLAVVELSSHVDTPLRIEKDRH
jgi:hypothetical protein